MAFCGVCVVGVVCVVGADVPESFLDAAVLV